MCRILQGIGAAFGSGFQSGTMIEERPITELLQSIAV
jgi:hypothetical protein